MDNISYEEQTTQDVSEHHLINSDTYIRKNSPGGREFFYFENNLVNIVSVTRIKFSK